MTLANALLTFFGTCIGLAVLIVAGEVIYEWVTLKREERLIKLGRKLLLLAIVLHPPVGCRTARSMSYGKIESFSIVKASQKTVDKACKLPNSPRCCFRSQDKDCMGKYNGLHTA